ncbi:MAG TPA: FAD-binding oxidoreductase, partial [Tepidiformaceae bacterium]|nr:FAD-binding oxidoreductase [Tepidiformaceae bacterium]
MTANTGPDWLGAALEEIPGVRVVRDRDELSTFETDWTRRFTGVARMACLPRDTAGVAGVLAFCARTGVPVVPQGGNTGLVGGSVPRGGELVLSTRGLVALSPVDANAAQVTAGAGVTLERLQQHVRAAGFDFGVDLAARGSATVGGMFATNAGGTRVLRYGSMREQVVGFEAVLPNGEVVSRLGGLPKDNTGYDLGSLLCGSEGTLAVVTRLRLRLVPLLPARAVALVGVVVPADAGTLA